MELNKIYCEDNLITLQRMEDDFLDLTITSPPYNVDLGNNKYNSKPYDLYSDNKSHQNYIKWLKDVFENIYIKTKKGGRCVINIGDGKNGSIPTHSDIIQFMVDIGWIPLTTILWDKNNVGNRTAWGSFMSPSCPSFPTPFEYILVFCKKDKKLQAKGVTDLTKQEFIDWCWAKWTFNGEKTLNAGGHPAAFPIDLPLRCLKLFSWEGAIVYDPFMGSGTTAVVCVKTNRFYIGSEISEDYCVIANSRLQKILPRLL